MNQVYKSVLCSLLLYYSLVLTRVTGSAYFDIRALRMMTIDGRSFDHFSIIKSAKKSGFSSSVLYSPSKGARKLTRE